MADNSSLFVAYTQKNVINMGVAISKTIHRMTAVGINS